MGRPRKLTPLQTTYGGTLRRTAPRRGLLRPTTGAGAPPDSALPPGPAAASGDFAGEGLDAASGLGFLAAPASDYVTGQCIYVDGGFMAGDAWPLPEPQS